MMDDDRDVIDNDWTRIYHQPKQEKIADFRYRPDTAAMISTGR
jgi:hypothetical protein